MASSSRRSGSVAARRLSSTTINRGCCICDRPCAILECQCLENFQHNTTEHGNLMKRLSAAFSMPVSARDLHSFSLCCSCEHHLMVIEQANRIKECIKQVFIETKQHHGVLSSHRLGVLPDGYKQKRPSGFLFNDSRSFDESTPKMKRTRISTSQSTPLPMGYLDNFSLRRKCDSRLSLDDSCLIGSSHLPAQTNNIQVVAHVSSDSVFLPNGVTEGHMDIEQTPNIQGQGFAAPK